MTAITSFSYVNRVEDRERCILCDDLLKFAVNLGCHLAFCHVLQKVLLARLKVVEERMFPLSNIADGDTIKQTVDTGADTSRYVERRLATSG